MTLRDRFNHDDYVTIDEYASKLRVTERTVSTWIDKGAIVAENHGRAVRIPLSQFYQIPRGTETRGSNR